MGTRWRIVGLLLAATLVNYMDRVNLSYAAPAFMKEYGIEPGAMGIVLSAFLWTYFLAQVPFGLALDRYGVRGIFGLGALLWGGATMLTATATGPSSMVVWRGLLGIGEAPMVAASAKVLRVWVADRERGTAAAAGGVAGIPLGVFLSSPLIGWLLSAYGWRAVFVVTGAIAVVWAVVWIAYYREPAAHRGLGADERHYLARNIRGLEPGRAVAAVGWGELLANRNILGLSLGQAALLFNLYFLLTWLPTYLSGERHLTMLHTGFYSTIPWACGLVGACAGGWISDALIARGWPVIRARKVVLAPGLVLGMASFASLFTPSLAGTLACLSVATFGVLLTNSVVWATNAEVAPVEQGGRAAAVQNCVGNGGGLLAPIVVGYLLQVTGSWWAPMLATAIVALVGSGVYLFMLSDEARFSAERGTRADHRALLAAGGAKP